MGRQGWLRIKFSGIQDHLSSHLNLLLFISVGLDDYTPYRVSPFKPLFIIFRFWEKRYIRITYIAISCCRRYIKFYHYHPTISINIYIKINELSSKSGLGLPILSIYFFQRAMPQFANCSSIQSPMPIDYMYISDF